LQLGGSNIKERKSKTKEWNDRIKKEKVSGNSASIFFFCMKASICWLNLCFYENYFFLFGFFITLPFSLLFHPCFFFVIRLMWVSSLTYPNLLGIKRFCCCCCCHCIDCYVFFLLAKYWQYDLQSHI
jgi:hypothetical protein